MKHPRQRRPRRVYRWEGYVIEVDGTSFWAQLVPADHDSPHLQAQFDLSRLPQAVPGLLFNLYIHRRGRKVRAVLRPRPLDSWTFEELDAARTKARRRSAMFAVATGQSVWLGRAPN